MIVRELVTDLKFNVNKTDFSVFENIVQKAKRKLNSFKATFEELEYLQNKGFFKYKSFQNAKTDVDKNKIKLQNEDILKLNSNLFELQKNLQSVKENIIPVFSKIAKTVSVVVTGLTALSVSTSYNIRKTKILADQLGITTKQLQLLELTGTAAGLSTDELSKSFQRFNANVGSQYNTIKKEFDSLNISTQGANGKDKAILDLYIEVINKLNSLKDTSRQSFLLQKLFGSNNRQLLTVFDKTNAAFADQVESILKLSYVIDNEAVKTSEDFIASWSKFRIILKSVKTELSLKFMPVFSKNIALFEKFYAANKDIISQNLTGFVNLLSTAFDLLYNSVIIVTKPLIAIINVFGGIENAVSVLVIALSALLVPKILQAIKAFSSFVTLLLSVESGMLLIGAVIAAVILAIGLFIDDLMNWIKGNDALLSRWLGSYEDFKNKIFGIFSNITSYIKNTFTEMNNFILNIINSIISKVTNIRDIFKSKNLLKNSDNLDEKANEINNSTIIKRYLDEEKAVENLVNKKFGKNSVKTEINQTLDQKFVITIKVPEGTSQEQSEVISEEVKKQIDQQFNDKFNENMLRGIDALGN